MKFLGYMESMKCVLCYFEADVSLVMCHSDKKSYQGSMVWYETICER